MSRIVDMKLKIIAFCFLPVALSAATIISKSGRYEGTLKSQTETEVVLQQAENTEITLSRPNILLIYGDDGGLIWKNPTIVGDLPAEQGMVPEQKPNQASGVQEPRSSHFLEVDFNFASGNLTAGNQYSNIQQALVPPPESLRYSGFDTSLKYFPAEIFGIGFRYAWGNVTATHGSYTMETYSLQVPQPFIAFRYLTLKRRLGIEANFGLAIPTVDYATDLKNRLEAQARLQGFSVIFPTAAAGIGFTARLAIKWYATKNLLLTLAVEYQYLNPRLLEQSSRFDGVYWSFPVGFGFYL
jgi:hypothetical protein